MINIILEPSSKAPIYKQLVEQFEDAIRSGKLHAGEQIPSMNDFAVRMGISKETVKKTYGILREKGLVQRRTTVQSPGFLFFLTS